MSTVTAEERVRKLARALCSHGKGWHDIKTAGDGKCHECLDTERVLREAGHDFVSAIGIDEDQLVQEIYSRIYWKVPTEEDAVDVNEIRSAVRAALERLGKP